MKTLNEGAKIKGNRTPGSGQNSTFKMLWTKWCGQNGTFKMVWTKWCGRNGMKKMIGVVAYI